MTQTDHNAETVFSVGQGPQQLWRQMGWGARLATISMAVVLLGTGLLTSLFLVGAALFCALVAGVYRLFGGGREVDARRAAA